MKLKRLPSDDALHLRVIGFELLEPLPIQRDQGHKHWRRRPSITPESVVRLAQLSGCPPKTPRSPSKGAALGGAPRLGLPMEPKALGLAN